MTTIEHIHSTEIRLSGIIGLTDHKEPNSISIYLPTHKTGDAVLHEQDAKQLKAMIRSIRKEAKGEGLDGGWMERRLAPLEDLITDREFWRHRTEGLAIFGSEARFLIYPLPIPIEAEFRILDTFYLLPLLPLLSAAGSYYLLALELERIRLFEVSRERLNPVQIQDLIPGRMEDRVGYDFEEKGLQFRSQKQQQGGSTFHGHDGADRDRKDEILRYFKSVDQGIQTILKSKPKPLLLASQTYLASLYRESASHTPIEEETLICNLSEISDTELHRKSWDVMSPTFLKTAVQKWELLRQWLGTGKASMDPETIVRASAMGKVDSLFLAKKGVYSGGFTDKTQVSDPADAQKTFTDPPANRALRETLRNGGSVYPMPSEMPPGSSGIMAALFRY